jgi:Spy/CpxP family protein refolding chaperone
MKTTTLAALAALATLAAAPALAQAPAAAPAAAPAPAAAAGPLSVEKTPIGTLWANPASKAVLVKQLPELEQYMDQIKDMTLAQVAPMSQGAIDDAKLKAIQADLDQIK